MSFNDFTTQPQDDLSWMDTVEEPAQAEKPVKIAPPRHHDGAGSTPIRQDTSQTNHFNSDPRNTGRKTGVCDTR